MWPPPAALGLLLAVAACGSSSSRSAAGGSPARTSSPPTRLVVTYWPHGQGLDGRRTWRVRCQPVGGDHPQAAAACAELTARGAAAFAPSSTPCPLVIVRGEPEARVSGRYLGRPVAVIVRPRCGSTWQQLHVLLTGGP